MKKEDLPIVTIYSDFKFADRTGQTKDGQPFHIKTQEAYINLGQKFPVKFNLTIGSEQSFYPPGEYLIDPSSFFVGDYDRLKLASIKLIKYVDLGKA